MLGYEFNQYIFHIIKSIYNKYKKDKIKIDWRKKNRHNYTVISCNNNNINIENINVGKYSYGNINIMSYNPKVEELKIGNFVSIADDVYFILSGKHNIKYFSTYPYKVQYLKSQKYEAKSNGPIIIEDDVWIGFGCIILSGVTIKKGAVVAAGSVITKDVEEFSIYGGNPAKKIKDRFEDIRIMNIMKNINYFKLNHEFIKNNIDFLYSEINYEDLNLIIPELIKIGAVNNN